MYFYLLNISEYINLLLILPYNMKRIFTLLLILVPLIINCQDLDYAKQIINVLASEAYCGRGYVDKGDIKASEFIASELQKLSVVPLNGKSYFQEFDISVNTFPGRVSVKINDLQLKTADDFLIESSSPPAKGRYGIMALKRSQLSSEEKVVTVIKEAGERYILIDNRNRNTENQESAKKTDNYINYLKYSPQVHIKGVIILTEDKLTWEPATNMTPRPVIIINKDIELNGSDIIEINVESRYIPSYKTRNVAGIIRGSEQPDSFIVVTAHYDHLGKLGKDVYFPGANDNASGVAMILTLADYYNDHKPRYSMVFIALAAEELGILGAKAFVNDPLIELKNIKFLINFDLAGTGDEGIKVVNGSVYKDKFELLTMINQEKSLVPKIEKRGEACNSDHCMFYQKGVPCFYIYTLGGSKAYHDIYDTPDALSLAAFSNYTTLITDFFSML